MLRLHDYLESGNGYKVRLLLHQLDLPYERIERDILQGETRTPGFLGLNPSGRMRSELRRDARPTGSRRRLPG